MSRKDLIRSMNTINAIDTLDMPMSRNGYPILKVCDCVPESFLAFDKAKRSMSYNGSVHFFIEDYQFERLWRSPQSYLNLLQKFESIIMPDFSVYFEMPLAMKRWNIYRNRFLARYYSDRGIKVIPNIQIVEPKLWTEVLEGLPIKSVLAVNCSNMKRRPLARQLLIAQVKHVVKTLKPIHLLCYGDKEIMANFSCKTIYLENDNIKRIRLCIKEQNHQRTITN